MTIVVCIKCSDGVALAADSMLSIGEMQHSGKKIQIIDQRSIFAFAGDLGLAERFKAFAVAEMPSIYDDPNMLTHAINISRLTADSFKSTHIEPITAQLQTIIVHPHQDKVEACLFLPFLNPRYLDSNHCYAVLGSGTSAALPFLAFLLESLNAEGGPPNLSDGKLFAAWAVTYAIQRLSGGVGGDINVAIATNGSDGATSQELSPENVEELKEHIRSATTYLKRWKQELSFNNSEPPPKP
jgi:20S proteasome alpha/beta subunit